MDNQKAFDLMVNHLRRQGSQSMNSSGCAYRGTRGRMCAIGCLIPDNAYMQTMEGKTVYPLVSLYGHVRQFLPESLDLAVAMQGVHDGADFSEGVFRTDEFEHLVKDVAQRFGLLYAAPEACQ